MVTAGTSTLFTKRRAPSSAVRLRVYLPARGVSMKPTSCAAKAVLVVGLRQARRGQSNEARETTVGATSGLAVRNHEAAGREAPFQG